MCQVIKHSLVEGVNGLTSFRALALNPGLPPGGNFDLSNGYLQLPTANGIRTSTSGSVILSGGHIDYSPAVGSVGADQFSYTLTDSREASSIGNAGISAVPPPVITSVNMPAVRSGFTLTGTGATSQRFVLLTTASLTPPVNGTPVSTHIADTTGGLSFTDSQVANFGQRYYRLMAP